MLANGQLHPVDDARQPGAPGRPARREKTIEPAHPDQHAGRDLYPADHRSSRPRIVRELRDGGHPALRPHRQLLARLRLHVASDQGLGGVERGERRALLEPAESIPVRGVARSPGAREPALRGLERAHPDGRPRVPVQPGPLTKMEANSFLQQTIGAAGANSFDAVGVHVYASDPARGVNTLIQGTVNTPKPSRAARAAPRASRCGSTSSRARRASTTRPPPPTSWVPPRRLSATGSTSSWGCCCRNGRAGPWPDALVRHARLQGADVRGPPSYGLRLTNLDDTDAGAKLSWTDYAARAKSAAALPLPVAR